MPLSFEDLQRAKTRVSAAVLRLPGVAGVGLPARGITVYLEDESPALRARIAGVLHVLDLPVAVHWETSGKFGRFGTD